MNFMDVSLGISIIEKGIRRIFLRISIFLHELIINLYEIFERLCKSRILDTDTLNTLSQRIGMLLGIIMLFIVSFSVIQMILEPEKLTDKEKGIGNIAKKIILVIVMLGTSSFVFNTLYSVQRTIIDSQIISKFLLPYQPDVEYFGGTLSAELFTTFFKARDSSQEEKIKTLKEDIIYDNDFEYAEDLVNEGVVTVVLIKFGEYVVDFNWLFSPLLGLAAVYFLFSYCLTVGVRTIQLAFLEIISPMAIISYLSPKKDTMFEKWWKLYSATYIDAFIRIMIINLAVFLISVLLDDNLNLTFWNSVGTENNSSDFWIKIFMILALLTFAKKTPDLLKDLFPAGASKLGLGVTSPKQLFSNMLGGNLVEGAVRMGTVGTAIGLSNAITSGVSRYKINKKNGKENWQALLGAAGGAISGLGRGFVAGNQKGNPFSVYSKGVKAQRDLNDKYDELISAGGSTLGKIYSGISANFGETAAQEANRRINDLETMSGFYKSIKEQATEFSFVKTAQEQATYAQWDKEHETEEQFVARKRALEKRVRDLRKASEHAASLGQNSFVFDNVTYDFSDTDDNARAGRIKAYLKESQVYANTHNVQRYDRTTDTWQDVNPANATELKNMEIYANETTSHLKNETYIKNVANDKAAGINPNGSGKK